MGHCVILIAFKRRSSGTHTGEKRQSGGQRSKVCVHDESFTGGHLVWGCHSGVAGRISSYLCQGGSESVLEHTGQVTLGACTVRRVLTFVFSFLRPTVS